MESIKSEVNILRKMILDPFPKVQKKFQIMRKGKGNGVNIVSKSTDYSNFPPVQVFKVQHTMFPCFAQEPIRHKISKKKNSVNQIIAPLNVTGKHFNLTSNASVSDAKLAKNQQHNFFISKLNKKIFDLASYIKLKIPLILNHHGEKGMKKGKSFQNLRKTNIKILENIIKNPKNYSRKKSRSITIKGWEN